MAVDHDLPSFIRRHFRSVWALEILLLLHRDPERRWRAEEIVLELRATQALVVTNLEGFERGGFLLRDEAQRYRFAPASPVLGELCGELKDAYRERPVSVINLISASEDRLQQLADAFRFKGRPK